MLGEIGQLDASLGRANERLNLANLKLAHVQAQMKENRRELGIAKQNLNRSQSTIAKRLVTLYTKGESSPLEVILGARSLDRGAEPHGDRGQGLVARRAGDRAGAHLQGRRSSTTHAS